DLVERHPPVRDRSEGVLAERDEIAESTVPEGPLGVPSRDVTDLRADDAPATVNRKSARIHLAAPRRALEWCDEAPEGAGQQDAVVRCNDDVACARAIAQNVQAPCLAKEGGVLDERDAGIDRKSTRLNSSHQIISYA